MLVYHGSSKKINCIDIDECHLGWHCGNLCQAIDIANPKRKSNKFLWEDSYLYVSDINPNGQNTLYLKDIFRYYDNFLHDIIIEIKSKLKEQFPDILYDNIDNCENNEELREFLLKNNIKYIEYDNIVETEGTSFVILDESELNNIEEYTFYEFLTMHYDKIQK